MLCLKHPSLFDHSSNSSTVKSYFLEYTPKIGKLDVITTHMGVYFTLIYISCKIGFFTRVQSIIIFTISKPDSEMTGLSVKRHYK